MALFLSRFLIDMRNLLQILFIVCATHLIAQDAGVITFEKIQHDFGKIKEDGGAAVYTYKFTNSGNKPVKLERVQPACGCTTPDWSKDEVKPGKEGSIKISFDPMGRPGTFSKSVTVYSNGSPAVHFLTFSGDVIPRTKTFADSFPASTGNLRYVLNHINFGKVFNNVSDTVGYLTLYNQGDKPMVIKSLKGKGNVTAPQLPLTLQPKTPAKLGLHYNAAQSNDYGLVFEQMKLVTDDEKEPEKPISVIADVHQFVPKMTDKELSKAPRIDFDKTEHNFGDIKQGDIVTAIFKFTNKSIDSPI
jgi:hypothetical protein